LVAILLIVAVVVAVVVFLLLRNRSASSSVDSFRRHIDALGPEARRNVVDQVQTAAGQTPSDDPPDPAADAAEGPGADEDDEGGTRGT
jgi:hypothetical protein